MAKRALFGLLKGILVGGLLGAAVVFGLGMPVFPGWLAYLAVAVTGAVVGLVAGKPIWAKDARIEAGLKSATGALVAAAAMFAVRRWLNVALDLGQLGRGLVGELPIASLPLIATALALFFEIDHSVGEGPTQPEAKSEKLRVAEDARADTAAEEAEAEREAPAPKQARRG